MALLLLRAEYGGDAQLHGKNSRLSVCLSVIVTTFCPRRSIPEINEEKRRGSRNKLGQGNAGV